MLNKKVKPFPCGHLKSVAQQQGRRQMGKAGLFEIIAQFLHSSPAKALGVARVCHRRWIAQGWLPLELHGFAWRVGIRPCDVSELPKALLPHGDSVLPGKANQLLEH